MRSFIFAACICAPVAIYSLFQNFGADGNFYGMMQDRQTGITYNTKGNGYLNDAQLMLASICAIFAWLNRFRLFSLLPLAGFVLVRGGSGGRGPFVAALFMAMLFYLHDRRVRYPTLRVFAIVAAGAAFFNWVGADRGEALRSVVGIDPYSRTVRESTGAFLENMDLGNLEFFEYIVWVVPQKSGTYDFFLHNLQIFTEPVPRIMWPSKPIGPPIQPIRLFDYGNPIGLTFSVPGVGWYSLGWFGVVFWCGLWGHLTGLIYRRFVLSDQSTLKVVAYIVFVSTLIVAFRDGLLLSVIKQLGAFIMPVVIWLILSRYVGVPSLKRLSLIAMERARRAKLGGRTDRDPSQDNWDLGLPPAVRRRRLALQGRLDSAVEK